MENKEKTNDIYMKGSLIRIRQEKDGAHILTFQVKGTDTGKVRTVFPKMKLPPERRPDVLMGAVYFVAGHCESRLRFRKEKNKNEREQFFVIDRIKPSDDTDPEGFFGMHLCGTLLRVFDTGRSWGKMLIQLEKSCPDDNKPVKILVSFRKKDSCIPDIERLTIGSRYYLYCTLSSPMRKKENGEVVLRNDLVARKVALLR